MADLKTRKAVKGTVKTIDRAAVAAEHLKSAAVRTRMLLNVTPLLQRPLRRSTALRSWSARRKAQSPSWASNSGSGAVVTFLMHGEIRTRQERKCKNAGTY